MDTDDKARCSRSQNSVRQEWRLIADLESCLGMLSRLERDLDERQRIKARLQESTAQGRFVHPENLAHVISELLVIESKIEGCKERAAALRAQIAALTPTPSQASERSRQKELIASLCRHRLHTDRLIDAMVKKVQGFLQSREKLSAEIKTAAEAIDLKLLSSDGLDELRFERLANALPDSVLAESKRWVSGFFGQTVDTRPYSVRESILVLQETLANANIFRCGDVVFLTDAQAATLLAGSPKDFPPVVRVETAAKTESKRLAPDLTCQVVAGR
jgi:hypothetical protein